MSVVCSATHISKTCEDVGNSIKTPHPLFSFILLPPTYSADIVSSTSTVGHHLTEHRYTTLIRSPSLTVSSLIQPCRHNSSPNSGTCYCPSQKNTNSGPTSNASTEGKAQAFSEFKSSEDSSPDYQDATEQSVSEEPPPYTPTASLCGSSTAEYLRGLTMASPQKIQRYQLCTQRRCIRPVTEFRAMQMIMTI